MSRTEILFGPPGTGKTTTLLNTIDVAIQQGTSPERIGYFAFTRKAAHEAIQRATQQFDLTHEELPWFRTLHSAAFKILGLRRDEVMQSNNYKEIGDALGSFTFKNNYDESTERAPLNGGLGDKALALYSLARAKMTTVEQEWRLANDPSISLLDAQRFILLNLPTAFAKPCPPATGAFTTFAKTTACLSLPQFSCGSRSTLNSRINTRAQRSYRANTSQIRSSQSLMMAKRI